MTCIRILFRNTFPAGPNKIKKIKHISCRSPFIPNDNHQQSRRIQVHIYLPFTASIKHVHSCTDLGSIRPANTITAELQLHSKKYQTTTRMISMYLGISIILLNRGGCESQDWVQLLTLERGRERQRDRERGRETQRVP